MNSASPHVFGHDLTIKEITESILPCRFIDHVKMDISLKDTKRANQSQIAAECLRYRWELSSCVQVHLR